MIKVRLTMLSLIVGSILTTSVAYAVDDVSTTLSVQGTLNDSTQGCTVEFTSPTIAIGSRNMDALPLQGHNASPAELTAVHANFVGRCTKQGQLVPNLQFTGIVDNGAGNALINSATGSDAATGIGMGVYSYAGNTITPNGNPVIATGAEDTMFYVGMVKLDGSEATPGNVQSTLTLQVTTL